MLFLLELHRASDKAEYLADARKGADELVEQLPLMKETGLYSGAAGVGFTLGEVYRDE